MNKYFLDNFNIIIYMLLQHLKADTYKLNKSAPLGTPLLIVRPSIEQGGLLTHFKFENRFGPFGPKATNHSLYRMRLFQMFRDCFPEGNFGKSNHDESKLQLSVAILT